MVPFEQSALQRRLPPGRAVEGHPPGQRVWPDGLVVLALFFTLVAAPGFAQVSELDAIDAKRAQIERIVDAVEVTSEELRDGMQFRIDALTTELAEQILEVPVGQAESPEFEGRFHGHLEWLKSFVVARFERLQQRIREEGKRFDEFDESALAAIARAFQNDLRTVSSNYIEILVELIALQERLGQYDVADREDLRDSVTLYAERLSGQIMLDAMTLVEFRNMLRVDPDSTELLRAARAVERKQNRTLNSLEQIVGLMERLDLPVGGYRALLLEERGTVGVELLDREVFTVLLGSRLKQARGMLLKQGPNIVFKALVFFFVVLLAYFIAKLVQRFASLLLNRESVQLHQLMRNMLISVSFGVVFAAGVVAALSTIGISLVPMLAGLGVAGIVIGFALQDTLSNFASGWMILVYRPYDIDDHVKVGGVEGVVKRMNLVSTTIATFDNQSLVIPNSRIWGDVITNLTANRTRRLSIPVSVAYGEDLDRVEQVLREEIERQEGILKKPEPSVFVDSLGSSEIVMMTHAWVRTEDYWAQLRALTKRLKQRLDDEDMEIPFPQQDIYIRSFPGATPSSPKSHGKCDPNDNTRSGDLPA